MEWTTQRGIDDGMGRYWVAELYDGGIVRAVVTAETRAGLLVKKMKMRIRLKRGKG